MHSASSVVIAVGLSCFYLLTLCASLLRRCRVCMSIYFPDLCLHRLFFHCFGGCAPESIMSSAAVAFSSFVKWLPPEQCTSKHGILKALFITD